MLYTLHVADKVNLFLGVRLTWNRYIDGKLATLQLCQFVYTEIVLQRFCLLKLKPSSTPMVESFLKQYDAQEDKSVFDIEQYH